MSDELEKLQDLDPSDWGWHPKDRYAFGLVITDDDGNRGEMYLRAFARSHSEAKACVRLHRHLAKLHLMGERVPGGNG